MPLSRTSAAISIRDAWDAPNDTNLAIEVSDPRRVWSTLLLAANRIGRAQLFVEPSLAQNVAELINVARRSIPGSLHHQVVRRAAGTNVSRRSFEVDRFPEYAPLHRNPANATDANAGRQSFDEDKVAEHVPPPANRDPYFDEEVRRRLTRQVQKSDLLREFVAADDPNQEINIERALRYCQSSVSEILIRSLTGRVQQEQDQDDLGVMDLPVDLFGLEPER